MDETWCTDVTSQEVIKKYVIKSWGHRARFHVTMLTNHDGYLGPFWTARSPKLDKKEKFFWWCMWHRAEFDLNVLFIHLRTRKMLFNALQFHFALQSGLNLDTRYSTRYSSIRIVFIFSLKGSTVLTKIMKQKVGVSVLVFVVELQKVRSKCISLRGNWGEFQIGMYVKGGRKQ